MRASEIEGLLPAVFQRAAQRERERYEEAHDETDPLPATPLLVLLKVMEALHEPAETVLTTTTFPTFFDPQTAPDEWLPFLAMWVDLAWLLEWVEDEMGKPWLETWYEHLCELVAHAPYLARWRGTARGLVQFLETATGVRGFKVCDGVTTLLKFSRSDTCQRPAKIAASTHMKVERTDAAGEGPVFIAAGTRVTAQRTDATGESPVFITVHNATLPACEKPANEESVSATAHDATLPAREKPVNEESVDVVAYFCHRVDGELVCGGEPGADVPAKALTVLIDPIAGVDVTNTEPARIRPFHIVVGAPAKAIRYRALVEKIVEMEKPAYVTCEIKGLGMPGAGR